MPSPLGPGGIGLFGMNWRARVCRWVIGGNRLSLAGQWFPTETAACCRTLRQSEPAALNISTPENFTIPFQKCEEFERIASWMTLKQIELVPSRRASAAGRCSQNPYGACARGSSLLPPRRTWTGAVEHPMGSRTRAKSKAAASAVVTLLTPPYGLALFLQSCLQLDGWP